MEQRNEPWYILIIKLNVITHCNELGEKKTLISRHASDISNKSLFTLQNWYPTLPQENTPPFEMTGLDTLFTESFLLFVAFGRTYSYLRHHSYKRILLEILEC